VRETIEAVLQLRELAVLYRSGDQIELLGMLKRPMREALDVLLERKCATSAEVSDVLNKNVNIVCNRLNALQRMGLVCRLRDGSVAGGGRQYYYVSIL
jgi:predicted transcriptional regulator